MPVRASLFITCLADTLFPDTGRATVAVLERVGVEVDFPLEQTCCGQMHANTGYGHEVVGLVRRFVRVFGDAEVVVTPSGSCAAMVAMTLAYVRRGNGRMEPHRRSHRRA